MSRIEVQDHEPIDLDPRRAFTPKQRLEVLLACHGRCAKCGVKLGKRFEIDHVLAHTFGGQTEVANAEAVCVPCHAAKTKTDVKANAKCRRLINKAGPKAPSRLKSRGFDKTLRKHMDGSVSPRRKPKEPLA